MSTLERVARLGDRLFDRLRHPAAFTLDEDHAVDGDFSALRGATYAVVVTFRQTGEAVPSPTWFALDEHGRAFVKTRHDAGKVKRLRNDPRLLVARSSMRGRPVGPAVRGTGRVLAPDEWPHAEATLTAAYGFGRTISERLIGGRDDATAYLEISPGRRPGRPSRGAAAQRHGD